MRKIKICYIITHLELGGAQTQLLELIRNLDPMQFEISLCSGQKGYLKTHFQKLLNGKIYFIPRLIRAINPWYDLCALIWLYGFLKNNYFDIVHTHSPKASFLGRWAAFFAGRKNIVYSVHGWPFHSHQNIFIAIFYLVLEKFTARITKKIILVSHADYHTALKYKIRPPDHLKVVHYGIDSALYGKIYHTRLQRPPENLILTVSALKKQKGLFVFLSVIKQVVCEYPELKVIIAGDGPLLPKIKKQIIAWGLQDTVVVQGWISDLSDAYTQAAVFLLTSYWEGLPVALVEAVVSGIPCVVTDTAGVRDIMQNGELGWIANCGDHNALSQRALDILKNKEKWSRLITRNRQRIPLSYWDYSRMIKEMKEVYTSVCL